MARRRPSTQPEVIASWERMLNAAAGYSEDLGEGQAIIENLQRFLQEARALEAVQFKATADRQEATKRLLKVLRDGSKMATLLRFFLKNRFGYESDRLVEFGFQPFRGFNRSSSPKEPAEPSPEPTTPPSSPPLSDPDPDPAQ
jgi:hypothetical protein